MPEGPECMDIVDTFYDEGFVGKKLISFEFIGGRYKKHGPPDGYLSFARKIPIKLDEVSCKGKMIYLTFISDTGKYWYIVSNLGLTGHWSTKSDHATIELNFGKHGSMYYKDQIGFGILRFIKTDDEMNVLIAKLGPDVIQDVFNYDKFVEIISKPKNSKKIIAEVIADQSNFSGIGNYLRSEILYAANIDPRSITAELSTVDLESLYKYITKIPKKSYTLGGSSEYNPTGKYKTKVYNQKTDPNGFIVKKFIHKKQAIYHTF